MPRFALIDAPSNLGLRPSGVELLPDALRRAGLRERFAARDAGRVEPAAAYDSVRDPETHILNGPALRATSRALSRAIADVAERAEVPVVLAGDCSVVLGALLGLRVAARALGAPDRVSLLFVDGHVDFYQPEASPTGEVADMDLALATGRGPRVLTRFEEVDGAPLVRDEDVAAVGARDAAERDSAGSQDIRATGIRLFELDTVRARGMDAVAAEAIGVVVRPGLASFWMHIDADVLDDAVMPAVDYRQPRGLSPAEVAALLRAAVLSGQLGGVSVAIYNPMLDPVGSGARTLVDCLASGLAGRPL